MVTRKTRLMSALLAILMVVSMFTAFVLPVSAGDEYPVYDATKDVYFNSTTDYNAPRGAQYATYSDKSIYIVADAADWKALTELSVTFAGVTIHLVDDIDMNATEVQPLSGTESSSYFAGTLDGHGHVFNDLFITYVPSGTSRERRVGLIGYMKGATVQNVGVANGLIRTYGISNCGEVMLSGIAGAATNSSKIINCWNGAVVDGTKYGGDVSASGIARLENGGAYIEGCYNIGLIRTRGGYACGISGAAHRQNVYNSFNAGEVYATGSALKAGFSRWTTNLHSTNSHNNYMATGDSGDYFNVTADQQVASNTAMADYILNSDAYSTGELAWKLNSKLDTTNGVTTYYTVEDGKTVFGKASNQTRKVTFTDGTNSFERYYNAGAQVTLPGVATYSVTGATLSGTTLTVGTTDATVTASYSSANWTKLLAAYTKYNSDRNYFETADGTQTVADLLTEAVTLMTAGTADQTAVDALVTKFNGLKYRSYPNAPKARDYKLYKDASEFMVCDLEDLNTAGRFSAGFSETQTLHFNADEITVTSSMAPANFFQDTKVNINGHGVVLTDITVIGADVQNDNLQDDSWLGSYGGSSVVDFTMKNWVGNGMGWQAALLMGSNASSNITVDSVKAVGCTANACGTRNGLAIIFGYMYTAGRTVNLKNITIENCTLNRATKAGNSGLLVGRCVNGTLNVENIYLNNNTIKGAVTNNGTGIVMGQTTGAEINVKNLGVFNTTVDGVMLGILTGSLKLETATSCAYTVDNVISYNNGSAPLIYRENDTTVTEKITNVYSTNAIYYNKATSTTVTEANATAASVTNGKVAWTLNNAGVAQLWKMENGLPVFADAATATRKLTVEKVLTDETSFTGWVSYVNGGTEVATELTGFTPRTESLNQYDADKKTFVMPAKDFTITYDMTGTNAVVAQDLMDAYAPYVQGNYEKLFDLFNQEESMRASYEAAESVVNGTAADSLAALKTAFENFVNPDDLTLKKAYPYYPKYSMMDTYVQFNDKDATGRIHWAIADAEDWRCVIRDNFSPANILKKYPEYAGGSLKINDQDMNHVVILDVVKDIDFNGQSMSPAYAQSDWTLDGHGHVFKDVLIETTITDPTSSVNAGLVSAHNMVVQNLGMEGGTVKLSGTNANDVKTYAASILSWTGGYSARMVNCWSTANVINAVTGGTAANNIAAGLAVYTRAVGAYNCYFGGTVSSTGESAVIWVTDGGTASPYYNVYSTVDGLTFSNLSGAVSDTNSTGTVAADAAQTGALAAKLNANYTACDYESRYAAGQLTWVVADGVTTFGSLAPVQVTFSVNYTDLGYTAATENYADTTFWTDNNGKVIVTEEKKAEMNAVADWGTAWDAVYTEETNTVTGNPYPVHDDTHTGTKLVPNADGVHHDVVCAQQVGAEGKEVACQHVVQADVECTPATDSYVCTDKDAELGTSQHKWTCACGNVSATIDCETSITGHQDATVEADGYDLYTCKDCDYSHKETIPALFGLVLGDDTVEGFSGEELVVEVDLKNNTGIAGAVFEVTYDKTKLTLDKAELLLQTEAGAPLQKGVTREDGDMVTVVYSYVIAKDYTGSDFLKLTFTVADLASECEAALKVEVTSASDADGKEDMAIQPLNATLKLIDVKFGDITGDKKVDIKDAVLMMRYVVGGDGNSEEELRQLCLDQLGTEMDLRAGNVVDVEGETAAEITIADVVQVLRYLSGKITTLRHN